MPLITPSAWLGIGEAYLHGPQDNKVCDGDVVLPAEESRAGSAHIVNQHDVMRTCIGKITYGTAQFSLCVNVIIPMSLVSSSRKEYFLNSTTFENFIEVLETCLSRV